MRVDKSRNDELVTKIGDDMRGMLLQFGGDLFVTTGHKLNDTVFLDSNSRFLDDFELFQTKAVHHRALEDWKLPVSVLDERMGISSVYVVTHIPRIDMMSKSVLMIQ